MANIMIAFFEKAHTRGLSFLVPGRLSSRTTNNGLDVVTSYRWNRNSLPLNGTIIYILKFWYNFNLHVKSLAKENDAAPLKFKPCALKLFV